MSIHDVVEGEVFTELERLIADDPDFCGCSSCKADAAALTMCQLPSIYSDDGLVEVTLDVGCSNPVLHATVIVTLAEAVAALKAHPRH